MEVFSETYVGLGFDSGWVAFYDFFERIGVVDHKEFKEYRNMLKSGIFMTIFLDGAAIACRRPAAVRRDSNNRLDNDQKPAIEWRDGFKLHYLHGTYFADAPWEKITSQAMTLEDIAKGDLSADQNAVAIQMLRPDRLLEQVNARLIHTGIKGTKLYEVKNFMDTGDTEYCMLMTDASTPRQFIEWIEPEIGAKGDADLCQANAFGISKEEYLSIKLEG